MPPRQCAPIGQRFGRLVVEGSVRVLHGNRYRWDWACLCDCGKRTTNRANRIKSSWVQSCGCLHAEMVGKLNYKHGRSQDSIYMIWQQMIQRCENPKNTGFPSYGGRGVTVCDRWKVFENFAADMGERPSPTHSIDRYPDSDGNYEPDNCRWATQLEQLQNTRWSIAKRFRIAPVLERIRTMDIDQTYASTHRDLVALRKRQKKGSEAWERCCLAIKQLENLQESEGPRRTMLAALLQENASRLYQRISR